MSDENLTNLANPTSNATITVRCIKSFEYRTCKNLVLQHVNLETGTVGDLKKLIQESKPLYDMCLRVTLIFFFRDPLTAWMETLFERQIWYYNGDPHSFFFRVILTFFLI